MQGKILLIPSISSYAADKYICKGENTRGSIRHEINVRVSCEFTGIYLLTDSVVNWLEQLSQDREIRVLVKSETCRCKILIYFNLGLV